MTESLYGISSQKNKKISENQAGCNQDGLTVWPLEIDLTLRIQTPTDRIGLMVEKSHLQVIGLDRGPNPGFLGYTNGFLG